MRIQPTQAFLGLVTTVFCTMAFSSTGTDQPGAPAWIDATSGSESVAQQPLLLAKKDKVDVCHVTPNGKFQTQSLPAETADKLIEEHPNEWILGDCEDVISPST